MAMSQAYSSYSSYVWVSARMTLSPDSAHLRAAVVPALPAPMTRTSQLPSSSASSAGFSPSQAGTFSMKSSGAMPRASQAPPALSTPSPLAARYSSGVVAAFTAPSFARPFEEYDVPRTSYALPVAIDPSDAGLVAAASDAEEPQAASPARDAAPNVPTAAPLRNERRDTFIFSAIMSPFDTPRTASRSSRDDDAPRATPPDIGCADREECTARKGRCLSPKPMISPARAHHPLR